MKDKILFFYLLFLSVFIPLYPKFPLSNVPGTYVAIRAEDYLIAVLFWLWFLFNLAEIKSIIKKPVIQTFLFFWAVGLLSLLSALLLTYTVTVHLGFLNWLRRVEYMGLFFVAASSFKNSKQLKIFLTVGLVTAVLVTLYGFGQYFGLPVISTSNSEYAKGQVLHLNPGIAPNSTFAGQYDLAIYLSVVLIFLGAFLFHDSLSIRYWLRKIWIKLSLTIPAGMAAVLLGLTSERMSFLATILGLISVFWLLGKRLLILGVIILSIGVVAAVPSLRHRIVATFTVNVLNGGGAKYSPPPQLINNPTASFSAEILNASGSATGAAKFPRDIAPGEPLNTTELGVERSFNIRTDVEWPRALAAVEKNPLLGTGYSSINIATDNDILRSLGESGILGTAALVLVFLTILKKLWRVFKKERGMDEVFLLSTLVALGVMLLTGLVIDVLEASKIAIMFWLLLGVAWAVASDYEL